MNKRKLLALLKGKIIVSCQAVEDEPLNNALALSLVAKACVQGGAQILRVSQEEHIKAIQKLVDIPLIGLIKKKYSHSNVFISPTLKEIKKLLALEVKIIALDATLRPRPKESLETLYAYIRQNSPETLIMADCATLEEMLKAQALGCDLISSTLVGYTENSQFTSIVDNDYELAKKALALLKVPFVAEGKIWSAQEARHLLKLGAFAVVVGSALTRPQLIVQRFLENVYQKGN